ncbi:tRNA (guanosine(46)-N7)-methyltransferase TrmB [Alkalicoccus urumqiensis]|uniref:tRNA (guanine-N(7)-)-methyltransferase n=1 Tax=Alkalicoccus urumqiensis TaxID=1548213 RepID=A0A2P6MGJ4_ALKUR|nr:tRNA (guanosine(46)-N7)-methyltransferase TrmB [Alkalicoccus urumqiensis]PRO65393.1 tRNA (guanosine(46)-N7)-methyltransferase TrmB [Alkalicoccus urumqiensis]
MRLRHKPWAAEYLADHPEILEPDPASYRGKWASRFSKDQPLYVEVGTGKGAFVNELAEQNPDVNVIGIELYESVIVTAVERAVEKPKDNLILLKQDVADLTDFFAPGEVDRLYINFTDPWPKNRHAKRRLTHEGFLTKYTEVMKKGAGIHFKTDNQGLFEFSLESMSRFGFYFENVSLDLHQSGMRQNIMTEYEAKFARRGMRIYRLEAVLH